jgi:hypothetical protein
MIDQDGRISLNKELQKQLGLQPRDEIIFEPCSNGWIIKAAHSQTGLSWEGNVLVHQGVCITPPEQMMSEIREERIEHLVKGLG